MNTLFRQGKTVLRSLFKRFGANLVVLVTIIGLLTQVSALPAYAQQSIDFRTSEDIKILNEEITKKNREIDKLTNQAEEYAKLIQEKQAQETTLQNELDIIANRIKKNELDIEKKEIEIEATNLKIRETGLTITGKESEISLQKIQLSSLLREIHRQDQQGRLQILLTNDNLSKFFGYVKRLEEIQANLSVTLAGIKDSKRNLEIHQFGLEANKAELQGLVLDLEIEEQKLDEEREAKVALIDETELSEKSFQDRLSEIRFQQRIANEDIRSLENEIKEKLRKAQLQHPNFQLNPGSLLWPLPNVGITTYFHDPSYPYRHIVGEHSGLDLRTLINGLPTMGIPIRAPASGVVVKTISNGRFTGNAIFISHGDIMTTFFHMSQLYVQADDFVTAGEIIGLSGGAPGHPGAGLSSGPHLHFEVRLNGIPVDPCNYLSPSC